VRVLLPLPDRDFDVTEVAVPWAILREASHQVVFATEKAGTVPAADPRLLAGVIVLSARGTATDDRPAFVVHDRNYLSARWPGDAYLFARRFRDLLESHAGKAQDLSRTARVIRLPAWHALDQMAGNLAAALAQIPVAKTPVARVSAAPAD
jgi:putative intracellular protease/amidase